MRTGEKDLPKESKEHQVGGVREGLHTWIKTHRIYKWIQL